LILFSLNYTASVDGLQSTLRNEINKVTESTLKSGGDVYTHWGRTSCPSGDTDTVYTWVIGGGHYSQSGSSTNYLCLPSDPQLDQTALTASAVGYIYGTEYQIDSSSQLSHLRDNEAPCAVCKTNAGPVIMIPARTTCYSDWKMEYTGYLMSQYVSHSGNKEAICVDASPEVTLDSNGGNQDGGLLYFLLVKCGALKCPPYVDEKVLTCVVCSKQY